MVEGTGDQEPGAPHATIRDADLEGRDRHRAILDKVGAPQGLDDLLEFGAGYPRRASELHLAADDVPEFKYERRILRLIVRDSQEIQWDSRTLVKNNFSVVNTPRGGSQRDRCRVIEVNIC